MATRWKLKAFLKLNRITPNALAEAVKGELSRTAVYNLVKDTPPTGVNFATIDILIPALTKLLHHPVPLNALLEYELEMTVDWRSFIGALSRGISESE